jgi:hypothetical protein
MAIAPKKASKVIVIPAIPNEIPDATKVIVCQIPIRVGVTRLEVDDTEIR